MQNSDPQKPLVSFCVKSYNQREYIDEALDGAFSQTYRPLEIVVCDDGSSDGSAKLIQAKIDAYRASGGDIPIVFHSNPVNLGNLGNWIAVGKLAKGELLVKADGDDVSLPERTETVVKTWIAHGKKSGTISHCGYVMDMDGNIIEGATQRYNGSCQAYTRDLWDLFPVPTAPKDGEMLYDDTVFSVRAFATAGENYDTFTEDKLMKYRHGSGDTTTTHTYRRTIFAAWKNVADGTRYGLREVVSNEATLDPEKVATVRRLMGRRAREATLNETLIDANAKWADRFKAALALRREYGHASLRDTAYQLVALLPPRLGDKIMDWYFRKFYQARRYA